MQQILIRISKVCKQNNLKMLNAKLIDLFVTFVYRKGYTFSSIECLYKKPHYCYVPSLQCMTKRSKFYDCGTNLIYNVLEFFD